MKRFEFRLDSVLRLRQMQLESEQVKLQQLLAEKQRLNANLEEITKERRDVKASVYNLTNLDNAELRTMSAFLLGMDAQAGTLRARLDGMARPIEEQRQAVAKAERKVRLLEKLRGAKLEEWKRDVDREIETIAQEAWLSARHARRTSEAVAGAVSQLCPARPEGPSTWKTLSGISDSRRRKSMRNHESMRLKPALEERSRVLR